MGAIIGRPRKTFWKPLIGWWNIAKLVTLFSFITAVTEDVSAIPVVTRPTVTMRYVTYTTMFESLFIKSCRVKMTKKTDVSPLAIVRFLMYRL